MKKNIFADNIYKKDREEIIYLLAFLLFKYKGNIKYIEDYLNKQIIKNPDFIKFFNYYKSERNYYLVGKILEYSKIAHKQLHNSYIENYNKIIKNSIGNTSKIFWPNFLSLLKNKSRYILGKW